MSSTNRGTVRTPDDVYETPSWCVRRLWDAFPFPDCKRFVEPFAGSGRIIRASNTYRPDRARRWTAVELRKSCAVWLHDTGCLDVHAPQDAFGSWRLGLGSYIPMWDACITNPPFSLATEAVRLCLSLAPISAVLLRLNWWPHMPEDLPEPVILPFRSRPSFTAHLKFQTTPCNTLVQGGENRKTKAPKLCKREKGHDGEHMPIGTDSCEYAWFLWGVPASAITGRAVLPTATKADRREERLGL